MSARQGPHGGPWAEMDAAYHAGYRDGVAVRWATVLAAGTFGALAGVIAFYAVLFW